jgi:hypothetical protein
LYAAKGDARPLCQFLLAQFALLAANPSLGGDVTERLVGQWLETFKHGFYFVNNEYITQIYTFCP